MTQFNDTQPIFVQIRERIAAMIINGDINEGDAVPSIRQVAMDLQVNPLTVTKAYQALVDGGIVEKRRGLGMYVSTGAKAKLLEMERADFLANEWPRIAKRIEMLGLELKTLLKSGKTND